MAKELKIEIRSTNPDAEKGVGIPMVFCLSSTEYQPIASCDVRYCSYLLARQDKREVPGGKVETRIWCGCTRPSVHEMGWKPKE